jgi:hypothetical protein
MKIETDTASADMVIFKPKRDIMLKKDKHYIIITESDFSDYTLFEEI